MGLQVMSDQAFLGEARLIPDINTVGAADPMPGRGPQWRCGEGLGDRFMVDTGHGPGLAAR
jgi:hypothetical protein